MSAHLFVVMGSGETTPTMVTPHQRVFERLPDRPSAVVLDTPYGFQENADELSSRTQDYFATNVGTPVAVVRLREVRDAHDVEVERAQATLADADWVFIGPGSPSYLLEQLGRTRVPGLLRERLGGGGRGATVLSSAAAVTVGSHAVPVYEIYKAGHRPHWLDGLDLLGEIGLRAVLIPHFDNAEGGTHDTRFCYLGERRLAAMEKELPDDTWVLGVDEHTAMVVDLDDRSVTVSGRGGVTVRRRDGTSEVVPAGEATSIDDLEAAAHRRGTVGGGQPSQEPSRPDEPATGDAEQPLLEEVATHERAFAAALAAGDATAATAAVLDLERTIRAWEADTLVGDQRDRAVASLRGLVTRLGTIADVGLTDPAEVVGPFVELLLQEREAAREANDWAAADRIREGLVALGIEVNDGPDGTTWTLDAAT